MICPKCGLVVPPGHVCAGVLAGTMPMPKGVVGRVDSDAPTEPAAELPTPEAETRLAMDPTLPDSVGGWRLGHLIGTGGAATVYQAQRGAERAAVKVARLSRVHARTVERAVTEARAAALAVHPNVALVLGAGLLPDGRPYLVTELLDGEPLDALLAAAAGRFPWPHALAALDDVAAGLEAAHARGVVHRDVKPGNVFVAREGSHVRAKLIDFGLALLGSPGETVPQTDVAKVPGTAEYASPEQARGDALDAASDLYALGVTAFELVTGELPFAAETGTAVLRLHASVPAPPVATRGELPHDFARVIDSLLAKRPDDRPRSAGEVRAALAKVSVPSSAQGGLSGELFASWRTRVRPGLLRRVLGALD